MITNEALGLASGVVKLVDYDGRWSTLFARASMELSEALNVPAQQIHHVGSTAVPGLCAKPVLDILVSIPDLQQSLALVPALSSLGYEFRPNEDIPDRHFFRRLTGSSRTHHLSLAEPLSRYHIVTLAFRDALRADPQLAKQYAGLKQRLAQQFPNDRMSYMDGKSEFVGNVLRKVGVA